METQITTRSKPLCGIRPGVVNSCSDTRTASLSTILPASPTSSCRQITISHTVYRPSTSVTILLAVLLTGSRSKSCSASRVSLQKVGKCPALSASRLVYPSLSTTIAITPCSAGPDGINAFLADLPQMSSGQLNLNHNPRNGMPYFNIDLQRPTLRHSRKCASAAFSGPGMSNFDLALTKTFPLRESLSLQFRIEAFNAFNHAQFFGPNTVNANLPASSSFGMVTSADAPRLGQAALKLLF